MVFQSRRISKYVKTKDEMKNVFQTKHQCILCQAIYWAERSNSTTCSDSCRNLLKLARKKKNK